LSDDDAGSMNGWHARRNLGIDHGGVDSSRKNAVKTRGRPFAKGNPGQPRGALNRTTLAAQALLDGKAETITSKLIELAEAGDIYAIKLCMDRLIPARRELPVEFTLPPLQTPADLTAAMAAILKAAAEGKILLSQAVEFGKLLQLYGQTANARDPDDLSNLTDEELRARILQKQAALAAAGIELKEIEPTVLYEQMLRPRVTQIRSVVIDPAPTDAGPQAD
jgi:hypothetical protein